MDTSFPFLPSQVLPQAAQCLLTKSDVLLSQGADTNAWYSHFPTASSAFGLALGFSAEHVASLP